jgi:uncharacterized protein with FMN-binding domain
MIWCRSRGANAGPNIVAGRPFVRCIQGMNPSAWMKSNLAGIGSAAVLTVYAAGYVKTKPAADRFANESDERMRATAPIQPVSNVPVAAEPTPVVAAPKAAPKKAAARKPAAVAVEKPDSSAVMPAIIATPTPTPAPSAAPVDTAPQPEKPKEQIGLKDGIYYGWGSSRHGDIQAAVEIKNGRIFSAVITQCLTQYSCSWISPLPPQVVQRQSAEVDYVSGATQSTNAFYFAVTQALKQAK